MWLANSIQGYSAIVHSKMHWNIGNLSCTRRNNQYLRACTSAPFGSAWATLTLPPPLPRLSRAAWSMVSWGRTSQPCNGWSATAACPPASDPQGTGLSKMHGIARHHLAPSHRPWWEISIANHTTQSHSKPNATGSTCKVAPRWACM